MELIDSLWIFPQLKELYAIFFAIIFVFGSITGLAAEDCSRFFRKMVYNGNIQN